MTTTIASNFKPSIYQESLINFTNNSVKGNAICNAVAGSGKSTTLRMVAVNLLVNGVSPDEVKIIVFNKQNSLDLIEKFGDAWKDSICTLHSLGYHFCQEILGEKIKAVDKDKYRKIAKRLGYLGTPKNPGTLIESQAIDSSSQFLKLYDFARFSLGDFSPDNLKKLATHHCLDKINDFEFCSEAMIQLTNEGTDQTYLNLVIDFTDMIYLPTVTSPYWQNRYFAKNEYALIDECQDLNPCQIEMSRHLAKRLVYVGDPKQSIYGFAGAGIDSYESIKIATNALEFPLSVCYRCPTSHIELVNKAFPEIPIEPSPTASLGVIEYLGGNEAYHKQNDLILSRKTAPLVKYCLKLIAQGLPAKVKGREAGSNLAKELDCIQSYILETHTEFNLDNFFAYCDKYYDYKEEQWYKTKNDSYRLVQLLEDKLETIKTIYHNLIERDKEVTLTLKAFKKAINDIFSDSDTFITLSTVHRAKGLEAERVFILNPDDMPMNWKHQKGWEYQQEKNILYVALTRSKSELYLLCDANWLKAQGE